MNQSQVLDELTAAPRYQAWLASLASPYLGDDPIELGSGHGDYAALWLREGLPRITLTELDPGRRALLASRFSDDPRVLVRELDLADVRPATHSAMVSFNVLEHIEDDVAALAAAATLVRPGGHVVHLVPAFPALMSRFDREIGHHRRYRRTAMARAAADAGLEVVRCHYLNAPGFIAWFVMMRLLRGRPGDGVALRLWDRLVIPLARWSESRVRAPFGQSVVLIARVPHQRPPDTGGGRHLHR